MVSLPVDIAIGAEKDKEEVEGDVCRNERDLADIA